MNNPRTIGFVSLILGVALFLQGLVGLFFTTEPGQYSFSSPWPALDRWLLETLGLVGVRRLGDVLLVFAGALFLFVGRRTLTARSRADAP
jgi:hypothetical protein